MNRKIFILTVIALIISSCAPPAKLNNSFQLTDLTTDEKRLWNQAEEEEQRIDNSGWLYQDSLLISYINQVEQKLLPKEALQKGLTIQVKILRNPLLNAFAYPNGIIYVHTGFLAKMENEAQLAALLGHETTHILHKHAIKNLRQIKSQTSFYATLQFVGLPFGVFGNLVSLLGGLGTMAAISGYSKNMEAQADRYGLQLMTKAGYDPEQALNLFQLLEEEIKELKIKEPFFFGSHPHIADRIQIYEQLLKTKYAGQSGLTNETTFQKMTSQVIFDNALLDLQMGRFKSTQRALNRYLQKHPGDGLAYHYLAETYRQRNEKNDVELAIKNYLLAIEKSPHLAEPHKGLGLIYFKQNQKEKASKEFKAYLNLAPSAKDRDYILEYLKAMGK